MAESKAASAWDLRRLEPALMLVELHAAYTQAGDFSELLVGVEGAGGHGAVGMWFSTIQH